MSSLKNFDTNLALLMKVHGSDVEILNFSPEGVLLGREERRYLSNRPENKIFHFYHTSGIYRCVRSGDNLVCIAVTDLVEAEEREHRERMAIREKYKNMRILNDLVIQDIKNYVIVLDGIASRIEDGEAGFSLLEDLRRVIGDITLLVNKSALLMKTKPRLHIKEVDVEKMVNDVLRELSVLINKKEISVAVSCRIRKILTDALFREIIFNLVSNAIDHSPKGGSIGIECRGSGRKFVLSVSDAGPGVPDNMKKIIFERLKSATNGNGMGLGLAVCKHIAEILHGRIWVEDNELRGASFFVEIPIGK